MTIRGLGTPSTTALVISECQNGMTNPEHATNKPLVEQVTKRRTIDNIAELADALRQLGVPIVHCTVAAYPDYRGWRANSLLSGVFTKRPLVEGHPSVEIHPKLAPQPGDYRVHRHVGLTAFHATELDQLLRNLGVSSIIMTGVSVNVAVTGSSLEAVNRGFSVVVPEDCVAGATDETHDFMLAHITRLLATITTKDEIVSQLAAAVTA
ncbi:cysteine hydrolase family protein [Streptomyces mexicanus]|uniref:Cysteine hydrolase n=1 Tax=Streptomyces mexicanus TaxID=178566 RepID=A0A7X1LPJ8_9ACTN|nr:cysteine hydrolase [Streptomyces mexicanus]MBC2864953.1 cysteine hydrolase [Streptomyces mexicanus]